LKSDLESIAHQHPIPNEKGTFPLIEKLGRVKGQWVRIYLTVEVYVSQ
jgi:hypothetical protein